MSGEEPGERLRPLAELARAAAGSAPAGDDAEEQDGRAWAALGAAGDRRARRRRRATALGAIAVALVAVAGGRRLLTADRRAAVTYVADGAAAGQPRGGSVDGYIPRVQGAGARLRFSEGTEVTLAPGSRAHVVSTSADGAALRLEDGRARFAVVHRQNARWSVEAGPFVVQVTGTTFEVRWSVATGVLRVHLLAGVVTVGGPLTRGGVTLLPGQVLEARPDDGVMRIEPAPSEEGEAAPPIVVPPPSPIDASTSSSEPSEGFRTSRDGLGPAELDLPRRESARLEPASPLPADPRPTRRAPVPARVAPPAAKAAVPAPEIGADWGRRIAAGDFETVLREAEGEGLARALRELPSDRLDALGDAARYAGKPELARRVLLAQRVRFQGSAAAAEAAFLLGRLAEGHAPAVDALAWYETYLDEAPRGAYAAEALGRKLLLAETLDDPARTREIAREYLERTPRGPYAARARALLEGRR